MSIGPSRPSQFGDNCLNCGSFFVMEPGLIKKEAGNYIRWKCAGCGRTEEWPAPYSMQGTPLQATKISDIME